jgi:hypothetical protein
VDDGVHTPPWREYRRWRDGVIHALAGGLWLHHHEWRWRAMAHLVSADRDALERVGLGLGLHPARLQYRPIRNPESGDREPAWHWDLVGPWVPPRGGREARPD